MAFTIFYSAFLGILFVSFLAKETKSKNYQIKAILQVAYLTAILVYTKTHDNSPMFLAFSLPLVLIDMIYFIWDRWKNQNDNLGELIEGTFAIFLQILVFLSWEY